MNLFSKIVNKEEKIAVQIIAKLFEEVCPKLGIKKY